MKTTLGLLHSDMHHRNMVGSICHLATSVLTVAPGHQCHEAVAKTIRRAKSGKISQAVSNFYVYYLVFRPQVLVANASTLFMKTVVCPQVERFSISDDMTVKVQSKPVPVGSGQGEAGDAEVRYLLGTSLYLVSLGLAEAKPFGYICFLSL